MRTLERFKSQIDNLSVPVVTTYTAAQNAEKVHIPTPENPQGPIFERMRSMGREVLLQAGRHNLYCMESLTPHHPGANPSDNLVYWVAEQSPDGQTILPWEMRENASWKKLARDTEFLQAVEERARNEVKDSEGSFFFLFGWHPRGAKTSNIIANHGAMSQVSAHFHHIGPATIHHATGELRIFEGQSPNVIPQASHFLDLGAEVGGHELGTRLKKFGGSDFSTHTHSWTQHQGKVHRQAYGFLTLQEVIQQLVLLDENVDGEWQRLVPQLGDDYAGEYMFDFEGGPQSLLLLPPRVTASVFVPSPMDKALMGLPANDPHIWVTPFSLTDKKSLVDGHLTRRSVK